MILGLWRKRKKRIGVHRAMRCLQRGWASVLYAVSGTL